MKHKNILRYFVFILIQFYLSLSVLDLSPVNFFSILNSAPFSAVLFYAPWCHHCHAMMPGYEMAEKVLNSMGIANIYKFNCDESRLFCENLQIPGFPQLKIFNYGKEVDTFNDERKANTIMKYLLEKYKTYQMNNRNINTQKLYDYHQNFPSAFNNKFFPPVTPPPPMYATNANDMFNFNSDPWSYFEKPFIMPVPEQTIQYPNLMPLKYTPTFFEVKKYSPIPSVPNFNFGSYNSYLTKNIPIAPIQQDSLYYKEKPFPMFNMLSQNPLPSFNQFQDDSIYSNPSTNFLNYFPEKESLYTRTFDQNPNIDFKYQQNPILWNPVLDLAHRALIKQTIYPQNNLANYGSYYSPVPRSPSYNMFPATFKNPLPFSNPQNNFVDPQKSIEYILSTFKRDRIPKQIKNMKNLKN